MIKQTVKIPLVFAYGWAGDQCIWDRIFNKISPSILINYEVIVINFGYFSSLSSDISFKMVHNQLPKKPFIAVGHSLGVLWLLKYGDDYLKALVSLAGTNHFPQSHPSMVDKMKRGIIHHPLQTLQRFYVSAQMPFSAEKHSLCIDNLVAGLDFLKDVQVSQKIEKIYTLHAQDDAIIPFNKGLLRNKQIDFPLNRGGHMLPVTRSGICARVIQKMLKDIHGSIE